MTAINHLKDREAQRKVLNVAFGHHTAQGHLCWSSVSGTAPNHQITAYNALGEGEWDSLEGVWYAGVNIPPSDYEFQPGALATAMTTGNQKVNSLFPLDVPHTRTAALGYKIPVGVGEADTKANPPDKLVVIGKTKKCPDFNSSGAQTDFSYSPNPGRAIVELLQTYARMPNLPSIYATQATYILSRIDWGAWVDYRDYTKGSETVDYTTVSGFEGFGLTASYFSDQTLTALYAERVEPVIDLQMGAGSPAVGLSATNFSARFEGFVKAKYSENYTFTLTHDGGAKLWVNNVLIIDGWATTGAQTGTAALTAGQFHAIKIEYKNSATSSNLKLEWTSTSQAAAVVSSKFLYPKTETAARYETHVYFDSPINPADAIRTILYQSNSVMQDVNGKLRFFCLEQLSQNFEFNSSNIIEGSFNFKRRDILQSDAVTDYEAHFRDLDSQYLEEPASPVSYKIDWLARKAQENIKVIELYNTTRWRALKICKARAKLEVGSDLLAEFESFERDSFPVAAGDLVSVNHRKIGGAARNYLIREASDKSTDFGSGGKPQTRAFKAQEWS